MNDIAINDPNLPNMGEVKSELADHVRAYLLMKMPKDQWETMIEKAWESMTKPTIVKEAQYGQIEVLGPSFIQGLVLEGMRLQIESLIKDWSKEWRESPEAQTIVSMRLRDLAQQCAKNYQESMGGIILQQALQYANAASENMQSALQNMKICRCGKLGPQYSSCSCGESIL